jgi:FtsZ-interacting cell division protein YlmF
MGFYDFIKKGVTIKPSPKGFDEFRQSKASKNDLNEKDTRPLFYGDTASYLKLREFDATTDSYRANAAEKVLCYSPKNFEEVKLLADRLTAGEALIVDISEAKETEPQRVIDFMSGVQYVLSGSICRIDEDKYLLSSKDANVMVAE